MKVLWSSMLKDRSLRELIAAARDAGYDALSVMPHDLDELRTSGHTPAEASGWAQDAGVELAIYDCVIEWYDHDPPRRPMVGDGIGTSEVVPVCAELGVKLVNAVAAYTTSQSIDQLAVAFGLLCDQVASCGAVAMLEFAPLPPVGSLAVGWEVVRQANRPNGKLLVDTWHLARSGSDPALLREIPGDRVGAVQLSDGDATLTMPLMKATMTARRLPGEGDFDLESVLGALRDTGGLTVVGPEVLTTAWAHVSTVDIARLTYEACERVGAW